MEKNLPILDTPDFKTEAEEAEWWDNNPGVVLAIMQRAGAEGRLGRGTLVKRLGNTPSTSIRLDPSDIELAKQHAEKRGLKYQTYLKMIIHEALRKEVAREKRLTRQGYTHE